MKTEQEIAFEVAKLHYEQLQKSKAAAMQLQGDYGKWLIASLLLIHGATLAFLAQNERLAASILPHIFWWHIAGLLTALTCGFLTWINWSLHASVYDEATPSMLRSVDHWPKFEGRDAWWINPTFWASIFAGLISAGSILGSAITVFCGMK